PSHLLPKSDALGSARVDPLSGGQEEFLQTVLRRWRAATTRQQTPGEEAGRDVRPADTSAVAPLQPAAVAADAPRPSILKRPLSDRLDIARAFEGPAQAHRPSD